MKADIRDATLLSSLAPMEIAAYLRTRGWSETEKWQNKASIWHSDAEDVEILLPLQKELADFPSRIADVLMTLSQVEERSQLQILNDLLVASADVIRIRLDVDSKTQATTVSLDDAGLAVQSSRELLIAAACAAIEPREYFSSRKFSQAIDYAKKLRMAQTEPGSYIIKVISKVPPTLLRNTPTEMFDDLPPEEPFERQVTRTLMMGLIALSEAALEAGIRGDIEPFNNAVPSGVSANLCDSLLGFSGSNRDRPFEISLSWSRTRPMPEHICSHVTFSSDTLPIIEEASRIFKEKSPRDEFELEGVIIGLRKEKEHEPGHVTVMGAIEGRMRRVSMSLDGDLYDQAIQAHQNRSIIRVRGELFRSSNQSLLRSPRHFEVIAEEEGN